MAFILLTSLLHPVLASDIAAWASSIGARRLPLELASNAILFVPFPSWLERWTLNAQVVFGAAVMARVIAWFVRMLVVAPLLPLWRSLKPRPLLAVLMLR